MELQPEGYAIDKRYPDIIYVPRDVHFDLRKQTITWPADDGEKSIKLLAGKIYIRPSGYRVRMEKPDRSTAPGAWSAQWPKRPSATNPAPSPAAANRKSPNPSATPSSTARFSRRISKRTSTSWRTCSPAITRIVSGTRRKSGVDKRRILSPERSLGSVIKLFTPSDRDYRTSSTNGSVRFRSTSWNCFSWSSGFTRLSGAAHWREHFSVDIINGTPGNELKCDNRKLISNFLRVGYDADGSWRVFGLRKDFHPAAKVQMEDDITASVVVPAERLQASQPGVLQSLRQVCPQMRSPALPAAGRGHSSRLRQADGTGLVRAGQFSLQFPAAHGRGRARVGRGLHRLRHLHRADAAADT